MKIQRILTVLRSYIFGNAVDSKTKLRSLDERCDNAVIKRSAPQWTERDISSTPISTVSSSSSFFLQQRSECDDDDNEENDEEEDDENDWLFECFFLWSYYVFKRLLAIITSRFFLILGWYYEIILKWPKYI